ncbi:hypothetical protein [Rhizobium leguminosarum]|nr:hypothetical protein [Rhizobium leguminosarum]
MPVSLSGCDIAPKKVWIDASLKGPWPRFSGTTSAEAVSPSAVASAE